MFHFSYVKLCTFLCLNEEFIMNSVADGTLKRTSHLKWRKKDLLYACRIFTK
jgi:hypothetical protein